MDYERIYREFIADRKGKPKPEGYTERHHILPRSLGGGDEPENLISLTAEDHFFAHLLLARIHGGPMWCPVALMIGGVRRGWRARRSRRAYGWAKRAMARNMSGENAHQFDWTIYDFRHKDGREWSGRQADMPSLGLSRSLSNMLIKGRVKSARGWYFADAPQPTRSGAAHPSYNSEEMLFRHVDGRAFYGTSFELAQHAGIPHGKASNIRSGRQRVASGWYRGGFPPLPNGRGAKLPGTYCGEVISLRHTSGREFTGTRRQAVEQLGIGSMGNLSMVLNGKRRQTGGWSPASR